MKQVKNHCTHVIYVCDNFFYCLRVLLWQEPLILFSSESRQLIILYCVLLTDRYQSVRDMCLDFLIQNIDPVVWQLIFPYLYYYMFFPRRMSGFFSEMPQRRRGIRQKSSCCEWPTLILWIYSSVNLVYYPFDILITLFLFISFYLSVFFFEIVLILYLLLIIEWQRVPIHTVEIDVWLSTKFIF